MNNEPQGQKLPDIVELSDIHQVKELRVLFHEYITSHTATMMNTYDFDFERVYPKTQDMEKLLDQLDDLKKCIDSFRPLSPHQAKNLEEVFETEFTYESNRIEGNTMTLQETALILEKGVTVTGKSLREHLEVVNHHTALEFVKELLSGAHEYDESVLLKTHALVLHGIAQGDAGRYRKERVFIRGSRHVPPNPMKVPSLMREYFQYYQEEKERLHPALLAADMSEKLTTIHPFIDGNGRTSRLIMNFLLMRSGFPITNISGDRGQRSVYFDALLAVNMEQDLDAFRKFLLQQVKISCFRYLDAIAVNLNEEEQHKGGYFFQRIAPFIQVE